MSFDTHARKNKNAEDNKLGASQLSEASISLALLNTAAINFRARSHCLFQRCVRPYTTINFVFTFFSDLLREEMPALDINVDHLKCEASIPNGNTLYLTWGAQSAPVFYAAVICVFTQQITAA